MKLSHIFALSHRMWLSSEPSGKFSFFKVSQQFLFPLQTSWCICWYPTFGLAPSRLVMHNPFLLWPSSCASWITTASGTSEMVKTFQDNSTGKHSSNHFPIHAGDLATCHGLYHRNVTGEEPHKLHSIFLSPKPLQT